MLKLCYVTCKMSAAILGEKSIPIKEGMSYRYIEESVYLQGYTIIEEVTNNATPSNRLLVPKDCVVLIVPHQDVE